MGLCDGEFMKKLYTIYKITLSVVGGPTELYLIGELKEVTEYLERRALSTFVQEIVRIAKDVEVVNVCLGKE